eukprot:PRCOL_00004417-RA
MGGAGSRLADCGRTPETASDRGGRNGEKTGGRSGKASSAASSERRAVRKGSSSSGTRADFHRKYTTGEVLGKGAFGSAVIATRKNSGKRYAAKTILKSKLRTKEDMEGVRAEIAIQRHLTGAKNVVGMREFFEDRHAFVLVMDLCTGGELFDHIVKQHHYSERDGARIVRMMLKAVAHCHELFVAHRDIKPENFLFESDRPDAELKLIDFGLSSFFKRDGSPFRDTVGTAYYIAPEVIRGASGPASDVWSLGVLTYVILCGRPPFNGPNDAAIYSAIEKFDPEVFKKYKFSKHPWPEISDSGKRLVMRMLQKDPRKRPMALELLNDPWVLGDEAPAKPLGTELQTRLQGFAKSTRFRKMALLDVAEQLHPEEIEGLRAVFERFDEDGDGVITVEELQQGLVEAAHGAAGIGLSTAEIAKVDLDGSGVITYEEFIASTIKLNRATQEDALLRAFDSIDLDGDGEISREELRSHIRSPRVFGAVRSFADSEEAVDELLGSADSDGDGRISYEEFVAVVRGAESLPTTPRTPRAPKVDWEAPTRRALRP